MQITKLAAEYEAITTALTSHQPPITPESIQQRKAAALAAAEKGKAAALEAAERERSAREAAKKQEAATLESAQGRQQAASPPLTNAATPAADLPPHKGLPCRAVPEDIPLRPSARNPTPSVGVHSEKPVVRATEGRDGSEQAEGPPGPAKAREVGASMDKGEAGGAPKPDSTIRPPAETGRVRHSLRESCVGTPA